jgi:radical SAM protein with 4Fe4S-binding SPASM domain
LLLTGGEPFTRDEFLEIYDHAKKKGLIVTLFTNGTTITPEIADHLADLPPHSIEITLYGRTAQTYESISGVPGSYERCMNGIDLLLERKLPLKLKTMAMTLNVHEIEDMKSFAEELGVTFRFDSDLNARLDGSMAPTRFRVSPSVAVSLDEADESRIQGLRDLQQSAPESDPRQGYVFRCGAALGTFHIDANGNLSSCILARNPSWNLRKVAFREAWQSMVPAVRGMRAASASPCSQCGLSRLCGVCPGRSQLELGHPDAQVDYLCQIAHLRADLLKLSK